MQAPPEAQQLPSKRSSHKQKLLFSGFVSYEQLEQKLLGQPQKGPRWLQKPVEGSHPVRMRGPGLPSTIIIIRINNNSQ